MNDFLISTSISNTLYSNMLTFRDSIKSFSSDQDLFKNLTKYNFNVGHPKVHDQKLIYEFGKEMKFNIKQKKRKSLMDASSIKLRKSPAIIASGFSTIFLPSDHDELCNGLNLLLQKRSWK